MSTVVSNFPQTLTSEATDRSLTKRESETLKITPKDSMDSQYHYMVLHHNNNSWHLGLSFGYHDSSAAIVSNDGVLFSSHEERFSRQKFDASFPAATLDWLISRGNIDYKSLASISFYEDPKLKKFRKYATLLSYPKYNFKNFIDNESTIRVSRRHIESQIKNFLSDKLGSRNLPTLKFYSHHESHAASSFFLSAFDEAACVVIDAVGEFDSSSIWHFKRNAKGFVERRKVWRQAFPDSYGIFYSMLSLYCGFKVNSGEYKLMGLAPYGLPRHTDALEEHFVRINQRGEIHLNRDFLDFLRGGSFSSVKLQELFHMQDRKEGESISQFHADIASSTQAILEKGLTRLINNSRDLLNRTNLPICLAGGVALNAVANGKIALEVGERNVFIPPAAGDAGTAVGCAFLGMNDESMYVNRLKRKYLQFDNAKLGKSWDDDVIRNSLNDESLSFIEATDEALSKFIGEQLASGKIVGLFRGAEEWGPRALGSRSILADPRTKFGQISINEKIKFRESFRPFAPIIVAEEASKYFEIESESPFMLRVVKVRNSRLKRTKIPAPHDSDYFLPISIRARIDSIESPIPAVTHVDLSARVQTITKAQDEFLHSTLLNFKKFSGIPILINTSFNVRGEPIVHSPTDAIRCFMTTGIDILVMNRFVIDKVSNSHLISRHERKRFDAD